MRLPVISMLHEFPVLGHGKSFIARKIPNQLFQGNYNKPFADNSFFVYKSVRYYQPATDDQSNRNGGAARLQNVLLEILVLTHAPLKRHENIIGLVGFAWETDRIDVVSQVFRWPFIVLEYAQYGSMVDLFEEENVDFEMRRMLCIEVGRGLLALHSCDIIHGDVKLENVLVFPKTGGGYVGKLSDFGFAVIDLDGIAPKTRLRGRSPPGDAPESQGWIEWKDLHLTDVYSFGFLIWSTMCYSHYPVTYEPRIFPFANGGAMFTNIHSLFANRMYASGIVRNSPLFASRVLFVNYGLLPTYIERPEKT